MNPIDRNKIWKMVGILALITVVAGGLPRYPNTVPTLWGLCDGQSFLAFLSDGKAFLPRSPAPVVDNSNVKMRQKTCRKDLPWQKLLF